HILVKRQFLLTPTYGTTFNSCQGPMLNKVVVDLTLLVFSHSQLYTVLLQIEHR
ncbi:hypothetical protein HETIRDRAFT_241110, partial [Heterobasidion irregulare TC 32-1]